MSAELDPDIRARKRAVRAAALARRDALTASDRVQRSAQIVRHVEALAVYRDACCVMAYAGFGSEIDTMPLLRALTAVGKTLVLPRVDASTATLRLYRVADVDTDTAPGVWGIREPVPGRATPMAADRLDLVLVPGVAFDRRGGRIGYGKGCYDRLLTSRRDAGRPIATVAAAFETQVVDEVPTEWHDVRIGMLVTEAGPCQVLQDGVSADGGLPGSIPPTDIPTGSPDPEDRPERRGSGNAARAASQ